MKITNILICTITFMVVSSCNIEKMYVIKKENLNKLISEALEYGKIDTLNKQFIERFKLNPILPDLKKALNTNAEPNTKEFIDSVFNYQKLHKDIVVKDGVLGPETIKHIIIKHPEIKAKFLQVNNMNNKKFNYSYDLNKFKNGIYSNEGTTANYKSRNKKSSATGKYQLLWKYWGEKIKNFSGNPNLTQEDFLNNPKLQEDYMDYYTKNFLEPVAKKIVSEYPNIEYSFPQIMALIHFKGAAGARKWIRAKIDSTQANNMSIDKYLGKI